MAAKKKSVGKKKVVKPVPAGYHQITPYLSIRGAAQAIEFYKKAFGARLRLRMDAPGGKIGHAELVFGDSVVMLADEFPEMDFLAPQSRGGTPVSIHLYVRDVDAVVARSVALGAKLTRAVADQFYGDRNGTITDPFGHVWSVATHKEDLTPAQMKKRGEEMMKKSSGG